MKSFKFYDDVADQMVTIKARDFYEALETIRKDYGPVYFHHMHYEEEVDNNRYTVYGFGKVFNR